MNLPSNFALRIQNVIFTLLFMTIIGLLAWLGKTYHKSFDFTQNQKNSLSLSTQQLLKKLDKPLKLVAYVPDDATVHTALKKLVAKYQSYKKDTELEIVNPDLNPKRAQEDGIEFSGQLLIKLGEKSETVSSVNEQTIVNVLQRLSRDKPRLAIFLEGHGERSPLDNKSGGLSNFVRVLENKGFFFQPHNLLRSQSIPTDASFVVIAAPREDYLEGEVKVIRNYVENGGNLLWLHEPGSLKGLDDIELHLGLNLREGTLLDANQALQEMLGINHPAVIAVVDYGEPDLTKELSAHTLFPFAAPILRDEEAKDIDWKYIPLLSTLTTSWLESGEIQGDVKFDDEADLPGPLDIAMQLTRAKMVNEKLAEQRVVVLGDSDFMSNTYIGQGSNLELASNLFNWLGEDDELISIKEVRASDTTLELSGWSLYGSALFFLLILPIGLILIGTIRWMKRRKR